MPELVITIPQEFMDSMKKFMGTVDKCQQLTAQWNKSMSQLNMPKMQVQQQQITTRMQRVNQLFKKLKDLFVRTIERLVNSMGSLGKYFMRIMEVASIAWGPVSIAISATGMIVGGVIGAAAGVAGIAKWLWDKMVSLGDSMLQDYLQSTGSLSSIGGLRSFRTAFGGLPDDPGFLSNMAQIRGDITMRQALALQFLGVKNMKDTADMMTAVTLAAARYMKAQPRGMELAMAEAIGLTALISPQRLVALLNMDQAELEEKAALYQANKSQLQMSEKAVIAWARFSIQIRAFWVTIESTIAEKLASPDSNFVKAIDQLSVAFVGFAKTFAESPIAKEMIDVLEHYLSKMGDYLVSEKLQKDIRSIETDSRDVLAAFEKVIFNFGRLMRIVRGEEAIQPSPSTSAPAPAPTPSVRSPTRNRPVIRAPSPTPTPTPSTRAPSAAPPPSAPAAPAPYTPRPSPSAPYTPRPPVSYPPPSSSETPRGAPPSSASTSDTPRGPISLRRPHTTTPVVPLPTPRPAVPAPATPKAAPVTPAPAPTLQGIPFPRPRPTVPTVPLHPVTTVPYPTPRPSVPTVPMPTPRPQIPAPYTPIPRARPPVSTPETPRGAPPPSVSTAQTPRGTVQEPVSSSVTPRGTQRSPLQPFAYPPRGGLQGGPPGWDRIPAPSGTIDRSRFEQELQDPAIRQRLAWMVNGEVGRTASTEQRRIQLETVFNRAQARGITLNQALLSVSQDHRRGYYATDTYRANAAPSAEEQTQFDQGILADVRGGSDSGTERFGFTPTGNASGSYAVGRSMANGRYYTNFGWYSGRPGVGEMYATEAGDRNRLGNILRNEKGGSWSRTPWEDPAPQVDKMHDMKRDSNGKIIDSETFKQAEKLAASGNVQGVKNFINSQGYHVHDMYCGDFVGAVVKAQGGKPIKDFPSAGAWMHAGEAVEPGQEQPGDIAVTKGITHAGGSGHHVMIVGSDGVKDGKVQLFGANTTHEINSNEKNWVFRRVPGMSGGDVEKERDKVKRMQSGKPIEYMGTPFQAKPDQSDPTKAFEDKSHPARNLLKSKIVNHSDQDVSVQQQSTANWAP